MLYNLGPGQLVLSKCRSESGFANVIVSRSGYQVFEAHSEILFLYDGYICNHIPEYSKFITKFDHLE